MLIKLIPLCLVLNNYYKTVQQVIPQPSFYVWAQTNQRRRYNVTSSLIGWAHTLNDSSTNVNDNQLVWGGHLRTSLGIDVFTRNSLQWSVNEYGCYWDLVVEGGNTYQPPGLSVREQREITEIAVFQLTNGTQTVLGSYPICHIQLPAVFFIAITMIFMSKLTISGMFLCSSQVL